jgi:hypothetical protein
VAGRAAGLAPSPAELAAVVKTADRVAACDLSHGSQSGENR